MAWNFALNFALNFLSIFVHISGFIWPIALIWASLERSFPPAEVSIDGANFGQKWWHQKRKKGQGSSLAVSGGTGVNGLIKKPKIQIFQNFWRFWPQFRQIFQIYHKRTHLLENWVTWLTHWLLDFLQIKVCFLDILVIFRLDLGQITFNPVENAFAIQQLAFLANSIVF